MSILKYFTQWKYRIGIWNTVYFNFRCFPLKLAIKFPVLLAHNVVFRTMKGKVRIDSQDIKTGMIRIGFRDMGIQNECDYKTIFDLRSGSLLIFSGLTSMGGGTRIYTKGKLVIGADFYLSLNSTIIAHESVVIGDHCTLGWGSTIMDTDFHRIISVESKIPGSITKPIVIGNHCWICNGCQILKGSVLPDDTIVGAMSLCNKAYEIPSNSIIAGIPARLVKTGFTHAR